MLKLGVVGLVIVIILLAIPGPLIVIWAVNTLFGLGIAYTFVNWLAVLILTMTFGKANVSVNKSN